ncbi:MAG: hypothetical protein QW620_07255 [Thermoplasmata archaeon]
MSITLSKEEEKFVEAIRTPEEMEKFLEKKFDETIDRILHYSREVTERKRKFYETTRKAILVESSPMELKGCGEMEEAVRYANTIFSWASNLCKRMWPYIWLYYVRPGVIYSIQPIRHNPLEPERDMLSSRSFHYGHSAKMEDSVVTAVEFFISPKILQFNI